MKGWPAVLDWMARIRVAGVESVATGVGLSVRQVHRHAAMLAAEGFLKRPRVADDGGPMLVVTPRGVREAGHEVRSGTAPGSLVALLHGRGVGWIAAHCERSGRPWYGPLELRDTGFQLRLGPRIDRTPRTHLPDLGFILDEERWAVEFERVQKSRERLRWILDAYHTAQLGRELECVLYVCATPRIERVVQGVASEIGLDLVTRQLERIIREARER
ncbi:MAG: hypothetical protein ACRDL6_09095 [Solirubrobacterales bacterium]